MTSLQFISLAVLDYVRLGIAVFRKVLFERRLGLLFTVYHKDSLQARCVQRVQPFHHLDIIGMSAESVYFLDMGLQFEGHSVNFYLALAVADAAAQGIFRHVAHGHNRGVGVLNTVNQMMLNTARLAHSIG